MKHLLKSLALGALTLTLTCTVNAQPGMGGGPGPGFDTMLTKFFGEVKGFSATAEMTMKGNGDNMTMPMEFAMLEGKVRMDLDLGKMKSDKMAGMGAQLKQMGMDKMTTIVDPKKKTMLMIYPSLKSYADMPMPEEQAKMVDKEPKMETTEMGKETIEGHPCKKNKVVVTDDAGKKQEVLVWNATDLKDFPVQLQTSDKGQDMTMIYKNIKLEKPDAKQFEPPAEFTKYASMQEMMQNAMMKMMGNPPR
jgi:hypothetical protein